MLNFILFFQPGDRGKTRSKTKPPGKRRLSVESLESRFLLSVSPLGPSDEWMEVASTGCAGCAVHEPHHDDHPLEGLSVSNAPAAAAAPLDLGETFLLQSNPGAKHTIYLDFTGHTIPGNGSYYWTNSVNSGADIVTPVFSLDTDPAFSNAELEMIQYIWQRVAEDYKPFNVNVTTKEPNLEALRKTGVSDDAWGIRVCVGGSCYDWYIKSGDGAGGVANLGSFSRSTDVPCYVFSKELLLNEKYIAEAISHEVGHTLGLSHDGTSAQEYYAGANGWAPIMGNGYSHPLTQWSKGEYPGANNKEDDLAIITGQILNSYTSPYGGNGFGYRPDDHGDTIATASQLNVDAGFSVFSTGIIERNTDIDFFGFTLSFSGIVNLNITPGTRDANLDVLAKLYDSSGTVLHTSDSPNTLSADFTNIILTAGTYYLSVEGTGKTVDGNVIYTDYGSLGFYTVTGNLPAFARSTVVTTHLDVVDAGDGVTSLREALMSAWPGDTITFDASMRGKTIVLNGEELAVTRDITIDAAGMNITIDANERSRGFYISQAATVSLVGLTITNGLVSGNGGGIWCTSSSTLTVTNCNILGNSATYGGGIYLGSSTLAITNCTIAGNFGSYGGGINSVLSTLTVTNCVILENSATNYGGGIQHTSGTLTATNCTITGNFSDSYGGGIYNTGTMTINNTIVAGNTAKTARPNISGTLSGGNNLIGDGTGQTALVNGVNGNLVGTTTNPIIPGFVNAAQGEYRLAVGSPAIDAGSNDLIPSGITTDFDGNARIYGGTVDIGAYEYQGRLAVPTGVTAAGKNGTTITVRWNAVDNAFGYVIQYATDADFTQNVKTRNVSGGTELTADIPDLTTGTRYYVCVMAIGTGSYADSPYSDSADAVPMVGYNAHDWKKYTAAVTDNGLSAGQVTWTEIDGEMRLTCIDANDAGLSGMLDLAGCAALTVLHCAGNQLTSLDVSGCTALDWFDCSVNNLKFSTLPLPGNYSYDPQNDMEIASSINLGRTLDLSGEYLIGDTYTRYRWYYADETPVDPSLYTETDGKFVFTGLDHGDVIYCEMTNAIFPNLTLKTTEVTVIIVAVPVACVIAATPEGFEMSDIHEWQRFWCRLWAEEEFIGWTRITLAYDANLFVPTMAYEEAEGVTLTPGGVTLNEETGLTEWVITVSVGEGFEWPVGSAYIGAIAFTPAGKTASCPNPGVPASEIYRDAVEDRWLTVNGKNVPTNVWAVPYDLNDDGKVDINDLIRFISDYGKRETDSGPLAADFDGDKSVNITDLIEFIKHYGMSVQSAGMISIPRMSQPMPAAVFDTIPPEFAAMFGLVAEPEPLVEEVPEARPETALPSDAPPVDGCVECATPGDETAVIYFAVNVVSEAESAAMEKMEKPDVHVPAMPSAVLPEVSANEPTAVSLPRVGEVREIPPAAPATNDIRPAIHRPHRDTHHFYWAAYDSLRVKDVNAALPPQTTRTASRQQKVLEFLFTEEHVEEEFIAVEAAFFQLR